MSVNPAAPNDFITAQDFIVTATGADIEIRMGISQLLHFSATIEKCLKLLVRHTSCLTTNSNHV